MQKLIFVLLAHLMQPRILPIVLVGLWGLLSAFLLLPIAWTVQANPAHEEEIARFIKGGIFDPQNISEDELYQQIKTAYANETDPDRMNTLANRLLALKWWKLWEANGEMPAETVVVGEPLAPYFRPSENWQWSQREGESQRAHYSVPANGTASHGVKGVFPFILPVNGTLLQEVYFPDEQLPAQIILRVETGYAAGYRQSQPVFVQARWTKQPEPHFSTENRPADFWAGELPTPAPSLEGNRRGSWHVLSVNLVDLGLCGPNRIIRGIEYIAMGGNAWFGRMLIRRPQFEIRGTQPYHVFSTDEVMTFDIAVHNFSPTDTHYTLNLIVTDYDGSEIINPVYHLEIPAKSSQRQILKLNPGKKRYFVVEYTLQAGEKTVSHGYIAATVIAPNRTGRKDHEKFGMMYWDQPGKEMIELYEKLGVKLIVLFPDLYRLHAFDNQKFAVMPMIWSLPERSPQEAAKLQQDIRPYLEAGQRIFSNFWETDLRVPPDIFAPNMTRFAQLVKQFEPTALVGIGGLACFNIAYLNQLLQLIKTPLFDFIALMLYNTPSPPEFSGIDQETSALRRLLKSSANPKAELWNVEWSYFENLNLDGGNWLNTGVPQDMIAPYTIRHHLFGFAAGIDRMVPGTNIYEGRTPLAKNYGHSMELGRSSVFRYDLTPLPLLPAYSVMTRMLEGKQYVATIGQDPNVICQVYRAVDESYNVLSSKKTVLILWTLFRSEQIALPLVREAEGREIPVTILNMVGDETAQSTYHGVLQLSISPEPTYILLDEDSLEMLNISAALPGEPVLAVSPTALDISPGKTATIRVTYHLSNPGWNALQGAIHLIQPNWITVLQKEIHYSDEVQRQLAETVLSTKPDEIWLGRNHSVDVTYELLIPEEIKRKTYYEQIELTKQPSFPITAVFESGGQIMARTTALVHVLPPLSMTFRPVLSRKEDVNSPRFVIALTNNSPIDRQGDLQLKVPGPLLLAPWKLPFSVPAGMTRTYEFALQGGETGQPQTYTFETADTELNRHTAQVTIQANERIHLDRYRRQDGYLWSFGIGEGYVIEALAQDQQREETRQTRGFAFRPAVKAPHPLRIDGRLDDWTDAVPLFIHPDGRLSGLTFFAGDFGRDMQWTGLDDFSAAWQMMWDESFLYLAVKTFDDHIVPQSNLGNFWNGDTISFQIDPLPDLTDASILPAQRDLQTLHTFDVGLSQDGPKCRRKYPTSEKPAGTINTIKVAIRPVQDGVVYELAIPWGELAPLRPEISRWMGFSLVCYEDDGAGRETQINWFGGSGGNGLAREPRLMGDVHFVE
jgi:hypothetical protein